MLEPGAMFAVGVPSKKRDELMWNSARFYNKIRLPHLTANWRVDEFVHCSDNHIFIILTKQ